MGAGRLGGRWSFLNGLVFFQRKKVADGDAAVTAAMHYMEHGSHWLLQILLADKMALASSAPRQAMEIYRDVLRDPGPADWASDPMESLAVLVTPHPIPYENWFKVALSRKDLEAAIEIGDHMRRHRFFSSMAYGGRLTSLRGSGSLRRHPRHGQQAPAAGPADALPGLRAAPPKGPQPARPVGLDAAGHRRSRALQGADPGAGPTAQRQPAAGDHPAGDGSAPRAGETGLPAAAQNRRRHEIAPQGTRPLDLRRHHGRDLRLPLDLPAVRSMESEHAAHPVAEAPRRHVARLGQLQVGPRARAEGPGRRQVEAGRQGVPRCPPQGLPRRLHHEVR